MIDKDMESSNIVQALTEALAVQRARVIDLFREWDADSNGYVRAKGTQLNSRLSAAASAADAAASDLAARIAGRNDDEDADEKTSTPAAPQGTRILEAQWTDEPERTSFYANDRRGAELLGGTGYPRTKTALYEHFSIEEVDEGDAEAPMMPMQVGHG